MSGPVEVLSDLLFSPKYVFCGRLLTSGKRGFCARYQRELPQLAGPEAGQTGEFFTLYAPPLAYQDQVRNSIRCYKFKGWQDYHKTYGRLVAQYIHDHLGGRWDPITWVPLPDQKRRERGYSQVFLLVSVAALGLGEIAARTLRKGHNTEAQPSLDGGTTHRANVLGVCTTTDTELVEGRRVLLIDDVIITDATISEYAGILRIVGAREVVCATLVRARRQEQGKFMETSVEIGRILQYGIGDYS